MTRGFVTKWLVVVAALRYGHSQRNSSGDGETSPRGPISDRTHCNHIGNVATIKSCMRCLNVLRAAIAAPSVPLTRL